MESNSGCRLPPGAMSGWSAHSLCLGSRIAVDEGLSGLERPTRSAVIGASCFEVGEDHFGGGRGECGDRSQVVHAQLEIRAA